MFLLSRLGVGTAPWLASVYMLVVGVGIGLVMQVLVLVVQNDARPQRDRRRDVDGDLLPLRRRLLRRRDLRRDLRLAARRRRSSSCRPSREAPRRRRAPDPEQAKQLPPGCTTQFLDAFAHSLHGVFLWGMLLAVIPFGLSWLLKEVPLRTTLHSADEPAPEPVV